MIQTSKIVNCLFHEKQIQQKIIDISEIIDNTFKDDEVVLVGVLNGCYPFLADLMRSISIPIQIETLSYKSYSGDNVNIKNSDNITSINKNTIVILVDDIFDSGRTMKEITEYIAEKYKPKDIRWCPLVIRYPMKRRRLIAEPLVINSDKWIFGYGLDNNGFQRNERSIYTIESKK